MNTRHQIIIPCQPANPVDYLACCGLADLLARMDRTARTHWSTVAPLAFVMESTLTEAEFLATLLATFRTVSRWKFIPVHDSEEPARIEVEFAPDGLDAFTVPLDWWYETLTPEGDIAQKSAWKMYAGNMKVAKTTRDLINGVDAIARNAKSPNNLAEFLAAKHPLTGRFGFDFRSSRDGIDLGFIANDLSRKHTDTFAFAELLAVVGCQAFFPHRCGVNGRFESTRAWDSAGVGEGKFGFNYFLWNQPLPITLARSVAFNGLGVNCQQFRSTRKKRGELSNLKSAIAWNSSNQPKT